MSERCLSCEITSGRMPVPGGTIFETERFHAHQDIAYPVVGLVILAAKRHFRLLTEMKTEESAEFLPLVQRIRKQQTLRLGIEHVYYFYNEDTKHHFHLWMVPRHAWMAQFGTSIAAVRPALVHARKQMNSKREIEAVAQAAEKLHVGMNDR